MNDKKVTFELVTVTPEFIEERRAEGQAFLDEFKVGEYEVIVRWPDGYTEYCGGYATKKDAREMISGAKRSKWENG